MSVRRHASAHVFVNDLSAPVLDEDDRHHLVRVLRLRVGETVTVADGRGSWRECGFADGGTLEPVGDIVSESRTDDETVVVFALTKGDKPELVVQKLTEIGVDRIIPLVAERSVVRWDDEKAVRNVDRLQKVAREAAMQSRRSVIPVVGPIAASLADVVREFGDRVALAEPGGANVDDSVNVLVIGPEGGFSPAELAACPRHVSLPGAILRAETAAIVAGVVLVQSHVGAGR